MSERFRAVLGLSIVEEGTKGWNDNGIVYHDMPYEMVVGLQDKIVENMDVLLTGLKPIIDQLVEMGYERAEEITGGTRETPQASGPSWASEGLIETWVDAELKPWRVELEQTSLSPRAWVARVYHRGYLMHEVMVTEQDGEINILGDWFPPEDPSVDLIMEALGNHV